MDINRVSSTATADTPARGMQRTTATKKIKTLIVDDEPLAREGVALALAAEHDVEIVGTCGDGPSAVRAIRELTPDLVFLDVKMPGLDGFAVINEIGTDKMPPVIFLTAHEEHALRAFRVNALDYLLKPIDAEDLRKSVERARRRRAQNEIGAWRGELRALVAAVAHERQAADTAERILVRTNGRVHVLDPLKIDWVEAAGDYVTIHAAGKSHLVRDSLRNIETRLAPHGFLRIHRSILVKLASIRELVAKDSGDHEVVLHDGTVLRLSRNYKDALYEALNARD
jgi:two-component system, LytTR family, response regulator